MKTGTFALASVLALLSTFAAAQTGGGLSNPGVSTSSNTGATTAGPNTGMPNETTTGSAAGNLSGTGTNPPGGPAVPHDSAGNPPLSPSLTAPASPTNR